MWCRVGTDVRSHRGVPPSYVDPEVRRVNHRKPKTEKQSGGTGTGEESLGRWGDWCGVSEGIEEVPEERGSD